jgi:hypothetical protein
MKRTLSLALLTSLSLLSSCYVAAAGAAGFVLNNYVERDQAHVALVALDVEQVWPASKEVLEQLNDAGSQPTFQDFPRVIQARVDGAKVTVEVEAMDIDRTTIRVSAEKYLAKDATTAGDVLQHVLEGLKKS